jgi:hypothetical protein
VARHISKLRGLSRLVLPAFSPVVVRVVTMSIRSSTSPSTSYRHGAVPGLIFGGVSVGWDDVRAERLASNP